MRTSALTVKFKSLVPASNCGAITAASRADFAEAAIITFKGLGLALPLNRKDCNCTLEASLPTD